MTQEDKQLLLIDLCGRLPYGVHLRTRWNDDTKLLEVIRDLDYDGQYWINGDYDIEDIKPYLRPMSSMTEEEKEYYYTFIDEFSIDNRYPQFTAKYVNKKLVDEYIDWLNAHHFDYRGLIEKGLAISTEEYNPYEK